MEYLKFLFIDNGRNRMQNLRRYAKYMALFINMECLNGQIGVWNFTLWFFLQMFWEFELWSSNEANKKHGLKDFSKKNSKKLKLIHKFLFFYIKVAFQSQLYEISWIIFIILLWNCFCLKWHKCFLKCFNLSEFKTFLRTLKRFIFGYINYFDLWL